MKTRLPILLALLTTTAQAQTPPSTFPFGVGYELAPASAGGAVDMSFLLDAPAGKHGFVRCEGDRFVTDAGEIRFWATNLSGGAPFPSKTGADRLADRLARLGINCVRLHWMDGYDIWGDNPKSLRVIDPERRDQLDYLIAALKKRGIYINMNLHVSRWLDDRDGFPHKDRRPTYDKGLDNFHPRMIALQKEFARDLLTHVNPYTGLAYTAEPAIAMIEINNENSVMTEWASGALDDLPAPYGAEFSRQWNDWLRARHPSTADLLAAWNCRDYPLGDEMLAGGDFAAPIAFNQGDWIIQLDDPAQADCRVVPGENLLRVTVHRDGKVSWTPQLYCRNLRIKKDQPYTLTFRLRADTPVTLDTGISMDTAPWRILGLHTHLTATPEWQTHTYRFFGTEDFDRARFNFTGMKAGTFEFAGFSLRPGGDFRLPPSATLEAGTVPLLKSAKQHTAAAKRDFWRFLADIEWNYWPTLDRFIKDDLNAPQPVSGTQLYYGSKHVQATLDYCDDHAYWNHPAWTSTPWHATDWYIRNRALINWADADIFTTLGPRRIAGKPHTISEYNHPFPNQFAAEGLPMICAFSQFQGWNGIFQYTYAHKPDDEPQRVTGYFDMIAQTAQLVHAPACAAIILRGDVARARRTIHGSLSRSQELDALARHRWLGNIGAADFGLDGRTALLHATALDLTGTRRTPAADLPRIPADQTVFASDTGELTWHLGPGTPDTRDGGHFILNTPKTKIFTGFIKGRTFRLGDVTLAFGETRLDWATVTLTETRPSRWLLAATGAMENSGMAFQHLNPAAGPTDDRMTLRNQWGAAPILCEGVPLTITLPANGRPLACYPLDPAGRRRAPAPSTLADGTLRVTLDPQHQTLWYEIAAE